jgi:hypothetical protein
MRTMEVKVLKYNELSDEVKEKVLDKLRDINTEHEWYEYSLDEWKTKLEEKGFFDAEIYFSGFSSQGDGACFDAKCDVGSLVKEVYPKPCYEQEVLQLLADNGPYFSAKIEKNSYGNHYSHSNTRYVSVDKEYYEDNIHKIMKADLTEVPPMISIYEGVDYTMESGLVALRLKYQAPVLDLDDLLNKFEKDLDELRKDLSDEIYKELEKGYDYQTSDEAIIETIEANDYEFEESGDMVERVLTGKTKEELKPAYVIEPSRKIEAELTEEEVENLRRSGTPFII